jgi:hypothetical protein
MVALSKAQALSFLARWRASTAAEREELRSLSPAEKLERLAALMAFGTQLGWKHHPGHAEAEVQRRWNELRERV